jgi:sugar lactone lactonase YvrE
MERRAAVAVRACPGATRIGSLVLLSMAVAFGTATPRSAIADGGGLGNLEYLASEEGTMLQRFDATNGVPRGHGFVTMHRGYLLLPFSADGGGGNGSGGFALYDVSDPRGVANIFTTDGNPAYTNPAGANYAGDLREPHGYSAWGDIFCFTTNLGQGSGLEFWDLSNVDPPAPAPAKIGKIVLPLTGGDYAPTPWWVFWQGGRYAYVAGTSAGIFVVDATDPSSPTLVKQIPVSQLGGFSVNTVFAVGNLLVAAMSDDNGISTFDISDPANPVLLDTLTIGERAVGYSMMVNGNRILGANDPARVWDISDPTNITFVGIGPNVADKGGYGTFQDGVFHYGSSTRYVKLDVGSQPFTVLATYSPAGFSNPDWDFATALGNLVFMGNDHAGSALVVQQAKPDDTPPEATMVSPADGATDVAPSSRVGLTFSDQIDPRSVDASSLIVRPLGGAALAGRYSHQTGIVNFWPDASLEPDTIYEVVVPVGGVRDFAGNAAGEAFSSVFSTGESVTPPVVSILPDPPTPGEVGRSLGFDAVTTVGGSSVEFSWDFGDGSPASAYASTAAIAHTFAEPGHYTVRVTVRIDGDDGNTVGDSAIQTAHRPLAAAAPVQSSTILLDATPGSERVWCVNPDNDSVTELNAASLTKLGEIAVGDRPRTLTRSADGMIWVANQDDDKVSVIDPALPATVADYAMEYGAAPFGILFSPDGTALYATLSGKRQLVRIDPATGAVAARLDLDFPPRGIAIGRFGAADRIFVTRFRSANEGGEIHEFADNGTALSAVRSFTLGIDPGPDREDSGRGVPNYISTLAIAPDLSRAWAPSKKDNIERGLRRDGLALTFESSVRTILSAIDLGTNAEIPGARIDFNDADMADAVVLSPLGDYLFVAMQGTNEVRVIDAYSGALVGAVEQTGLAPQGLAIDPAGATLYVHNFMSRSVAAYSIAGLTQSIDFTMPLLGTIPTVETDALSATVLLGKQVFHNAADRRMNLDRYLSCASCHLDGGQDGRVWDFSNRGEGFRNTISLEGRGGTAMGRVHWSGNFDEIQDFENDIRGGFGGLGFLSDDQFGLTDRGDPLGASKAGLNADLDALADYVGSLQTVGRSPYRNPDGSLTADGVLGRDVFNRLDCYECHGGGGFTDSAQGLSHDVGTIAQESGFARGYPIRGLDTPTLRGLWKTAPYLHHGGAATLADVLTAAHGVPAETGGEDRARLIAYLLQIDDNEPAAQSATRVRLTSPADQAAVTPGQGLELVAETEGDFARVEFRLKEGFADGAAIGDDTAGVDVWSAVWPSVPQGRHTVVARATDRTGAVSSSKPITILAGVETGFSLKINFQPEFSGGSGPLAVPEGYEPDYGNVYGPRGGGPTYGWDADNTANTRYRQANPDLRYDTLNHLQRDGSRVWEVELANGVYTVSLTLGDPSFTDSINSIVVEGVLHPDPDGLDSFDTVEAVVEVSDGRLTLAPGPSSANLKIAFLEIAGESRENLPPTVSLVMPADGSSYPLGHTLPVHVAAEDPGGSIDEVELYVDGNPFTPNAAHRPYFWTVPGLSAGAHTLYAVATDNRGAATQSASVVVYPTGDAIYHLSVDDGIGTGDYTAGTSVTVRAGEPLAGRRFWKWSGDVQYLADPPASETALEMPTADVSIRALYRPENSAWDWRLYE